MPDAPQARAVAEGTSAATPTVSPEPVPAAEAMPDLGEIAPVETRSDLDDVAEGFFHEGNTKAVQAFDSLLPSTSEVNAPPPLSVEQIDRRQRFRRIVGGAVGALALFGVVAAAMSGSSDDVSEPTAALAGGSIAAPIPTAPRPVGDEAPAIKKAEVAPEKVQHADAAADVEADKVEEGDQGEAAVDDGNAEGSNANAEELTQDALAKLNRGQRKEAIVTAQAAIDADPEAALPYLLLGAAHQDLGDWPSARAAYDGCAQKATRGPVYECLALGGRR